MYGTQQPAVALKSTALCHACFPAARPSPAGRGESVPDALLLLLAARLSLADTAVLSCCCRAFRDCLAAAGYIWQQHHSQLLGEPGGQPAAAAAAATRTAALEQQDNCNSAVCCI
jgi:hypothetical protein